LILTTDDTGGLKWRSTGYSFIIINSLDLSFFSYRYFGCLDAECRARESDFVEWTRKLNGRVRERGPFVVHPYFQRIQQTLPRTGFPEIVRPNVYNGGDLIDLYKAPWEAMMINRAISMKNALPQDGFKIEKDKCIMTQWLIGAGLPTPAIAGPWRTLEGTVTALREGSFDLRFPVFLKACHITQGDQNGVLKIKTKADLIDEFTRIQAWTKKLWNTLANDDVRSWAPEADKFLATLQPGFMVVESFEADEFREDKLDFFWGEPYFGVNLQDMDTDVNKSLIGMPLQEQCIQARSDLSDPKLTQVIELGYKVAAAAGADNIRVDIFYDGSDPSKAAVNEISLFSGSPCIYNHGIQMGKAWLYGYQNDGLHVVADTTLPPYTAWANAGNGRG